MTAAGPVIEARGVDLTFATRDGPVHALKGVDLRVSRGDFVSFIGPSGCGKTTLLRCIAALETPTGGRLTVNGIAPDAARRALGHVGAAQTLPDDLAGYELEEALRALAEITGQDVQEDVVDAVFRNFCVGK